MGGQKITEVFIHSLELGHSAATRAIKASGMYLLPFVSHIMDTVVIQSALEMEVQMDQKLDA